MLLPPEMEVACKENSDNPNLPWLQEEKPLMSVYSLSGATITITKIVIDFLYHFGDIYQLLACFKKLNYVLYLPKRQIKTYMDTYPCSFTYTHPYK